MIKLFIGGVGSGKSVSIMREIKRRKQDCFVNFSCNIKGCTRLKEEHIIKEVVIGYKRDGTPIMKKEVNYDFWKGLISKGNKFDIYIDEAHNIMHSRRSTSTWNTLFTMWLSQIRKILGSSEKNHIYIISQRITGIDVVGRDLCHEITYMHKIESSIKVNTPVVESGRKLKKPIKLIYVVQYVFIGDLCIENFIRFLSTGQKTYSYRQYFIANFYFRFYDSYELLDFGKGVYV